MIVICEICGTPHRAITGDQAQSLLESQLLAWDGRGDPPDWADYEHCHSCGADASMFTESSGKDAEDGCAIIWEKMP